MRKLLRRPLLLLSLVMLPLLAVEVGTQVEFWRQREAELHADALRLLDGVGAEQQRLADDVHHILDTLAAGVGSRLGGADCQAVMDGLRRRLPDYLVVESVGLDGTVRCATDARAVGVFVGDRENIRRALAEDGFALGGYSVARGIGHTVLTFGLPLTGADGERAGVLAALLDVAWLDEFLKRKPLPDGAAVLLADRSGTVLARTPPLPDAVGEPLPERFRFLLDGNRQGTVEIEGLDGATRVTAYSTVDAGLPGMAIMVGIDKAAAMAPVNRALLRGLSIFAGVLATCYAGAAWGVRRLVRLQDRLVLALKCGNAGTYELDARTGRSSWSGETFRILGLDPRRDKPGFETWASLLHPDDRAAVLAQRQALLDARAEDLQLVYRIVRPDGAVAWVETIGKIAYAANGTPTRSIGLYVDVTVRKRAEEALRASEQRYRGLVETQADLVVRIGADGRFTFVNDTACRMLGHPPDELLASQWFCFVHPDDHGAIMAAIEDTKTAADHRTTVEARILTVNGVRWYAWEGSAIFDEAGAFVEKQSVGRDITERKAMEEELRRAKEEADQTNLAKSKFLAAASHDLRQPMQSMFMFAAALHPHVASSRGQNALIMLERGLDTMKGLLDSLLDVSRLDADVIRPTVEDVELQPLLDTIGASYVPVAAAKGLELQVDSPTGVVVRSDRNLLGRMVRNLVENAIRYTEQGFVRLVCRVVNGRARVEVHDTGIGIPASQLERIFEEFHQLANTERDRSQGLGLGLSIVQRLSRLLDHPVEVQSVPGRGSVFSIDVPLGEAVAAAGVPPGAPVPTEGAGRFAVLVDDDAIVLLGLQSIFRDWEYQTLIAASAEQAVERLKEKGLVPDIVVADYRLRGGERGTDAVQRIREFLGVAVPAIILTGETGLEWQKEAADLGYGVAFKPATPRQLRELIQRQLGNAA